MTQQIPWNRLSHHGPPLFLFHHPNPVLPRCLCSHQQLIDHTSGHHHQHSFTIVIVSVLVTSPGFSSGNLDQGHLCVAKANSEGVGSNVMFHLYVPGRIPQANDLPYVFSQTWNSGLFMKQDSKIQL
jgi:hypothetical protein